VQDDVPACVTVNVRPATVSVPMRWPVPVFGATVKATLPAPLPDAPLVIVIQAALLVAVHAQPVLAATDSEALSPAAGEFRLMGLSE
jgi:hypothetical protein